MRKSSTKSTSNIYLRDQTKLLSEKYSPEYRKRKVRNIRIKIENPDLNKLLEKAKKHQHPYLEKNIEVPSGRIINPQNIVQSQRLNQSASQKMRSTFSKSLSSKLYHFQQYSPSQMRKKDIQIMRKLRTKQQKRQFKKKLQQIQFQYQQRKREKEIKLKRKTSESSFILETHNETIELVKKTRNQKTRSELKITKQKLYQTQRNHEFQILKNKVEKMQRSQILTYNKVFLKNESIKSNIADSKMSLSLKMSGCIESKLKLLPEIKEKAKSRKKDRGIKKNLDQKLNLYNQSIPSQPVASNATEITAELIQKKEEKIEIQERKQQIEKEDNPAEIVQNQIESKNL